LLLVSLTNAGIPNERRMEWRIGIHIGDVLIEGDDILGDGVNIAARLKGIAEPSGICISDDAFRQVRGKVETEFADIGEQSLKNIARPLRVFRLSPSSSPAQPIAPPAALPLPDKPSIAVLPFANMSGDPEQEYFADGMVEETTSQNLDLSNSTAFASPARCQVDSLMDFFGLAVNRLLQL